MKMKLLAAAVAMTLSSGCSFNQEKDSKDCDRVRFVYVNILCW